MDARIDPAQAYGISLGDAHVIRNAGASAVDALRSIVISEQLLGVSDTTPTAPPYSCLAVREPLSGHG